MTYSITGDAMKWTNREQVLKAVVRKALESIQHGTAVIDVLVTLQQGISTEAVSPRRV